MIKRLSGSSFTFAFDKYFIASINNYIATAAMSTDHHEYARACVCLSVADLERY